MIVDDLIFSAIGFALGIVVGWHIRQHFRYNWHRNRKA